MPYWYALYLWSLMFQPHYQPAPTMAPVYWQQTMPLAPIAKPVIVQPAPAIVSPQYPPGYVPNPTQLFSGCRVIQPGLSVCS